MNSKTLFSMVLGLEALWEVKEIIFLKGKEVVEAIVLRQEPVHLVRRIYNIPERTIFDWSSLYRSGAWGAFKERMRSDRPRKLSADHMKWIYKSYKQDPKKIKQYLSETFPEAVAQAREMGAVIFFVDEASVRSDAHRGLTWGKIGDTPVVKNNGRRFSLNVISAISPRGDMRFSFIEEQMNSKKFIEFLKKLHKDVGKPILVITDNARYHHSKETQAFVSQQEGRILLRFLPAYSPELNPDEQVWNHAKARLGKRSIFNKEDMKRNMISILHSIQKQVSLIKSSFRMKDTKYILEAAP